MEPQTITRFNKPLDRNNPKDWQISFYKDNGVPKIRIDNGVRYRRFDASEFIDKQFI